MSGKWWQAIRRGIGGDPPPERRYQLGLDFGTCWSKLVLRDIQAGQDRSFAVLDGASSGQAACLIPSLVVADGQTLHFGSEAFARQRHPGVVPYPSIKVRATLPSAYRGVENPLPDGIDSADLAALAILFLLQVGREAADEDAARFHAKSRLFFTTGAPMGGLKDAALHEAYVQIARTAFEAFLLQAEGLHRGIRVSECQKLLLEARARTSSKAPGSLRDWVRSEAESALLWFVRSPKVRPDLYAAVDVGAGTTDLSFFRIVETFTDKRWRVSRLAFYSAVAGPPGMDAVGSVLAGTAGLLEIRGREAELLEGAASTAESGVSSVVEEIFALYRKGFQSAYAKERRQGAWDEFKVFRLGGGSYFPPIVNRLRKPPSKNIHAPVFAEPGAPTDLKIPSAVQLDPRFLLVAYGLSVPGLEVPLVDTPDEVQPLDRRLTFEPPYAQEEAYWTDS